MSGSYGMCSRCGGGSIGHVTHSFGLSESPAVCPRCGRGLVRECGACAGTGKGRRCGECGRTLDCGECDGTGKIYDRAHECGAAR